MYIFLDIKELLNIILKIIYTTYNVRHLSIYLLYTHDPHLDSGT